MIWVCVILPFPLEVLLQSIDLCCYTCFAACYDVPVMCDLAV